MTRPLNFALTAFTNENLETSMPVPWLASQWPLPAGSYFEMDVRANVDEPPVLTFSSENSPRTGTRPIHTLYDQTKNVLYLGILATKDAIEGLASPRHYVFDIRLVRPRGSSEPRVDVIGQGFLVIRKGVTRG